MEEQFTYWKAKQNLILKEENEIFMRFQEMLLRMSLKILKTLIKRKKKWSNIEMIDLKKKSTGQTILTQMLNYEKDLAQHLYEKGKVMFIWVQTLVIKLLSQEWFLNKTNYQSNCLNGFLLIYERRF